MIPAALAIVALDGTETTFPFMQSLTCMGRFSFSMG
jgi:hypothetical protein